MFIAKPELSVEALQPISSRLGASAGGRVQPARAWAREHLATTPGRLVLLAILTVTGAICFGVIVSAAERSRERAVEAVRTQTEPLLVQAVNLYTGLADANATATTTFLRGGLEPSARRAHYVDDLRFASAALATLTRDVGESTDARVAVDTIGQELPVYSGLVESARANNRQGFPVGAAYLRQASALLTGTILPAASHLYAIEAGHLNDNYGAGGATSVLVVLVVTIVVGFALLILTQRYLARISRRLVNVPMLLACSVLVVVAVWALGGVISEQNALAAARRDSDSVEVLSASRILLSRAQSDESLTLVNRGSDDTDPIDFAHVTHALAPPSGLIGEAQALAPLSEMSATNQLGGEFQAFEASPTSASASDRLNANLQGQIQVAQAGFTSVAGDSASWLFGLSVAIPVLTAVAAILALLGIRQRLEEYR